MINEEIPIVIQLMNANATANWYFWHSSPILTLQPPKSLKYNTVMPAEDEAAARLRVAVTCKSLDLVKEQFIIPEPEYVFWLVGY